MEDVLWENDGYRITADGKLWFLGTQKWEVFERQQTPMERELVRRLLAERAEQEKLDGHNDKMEMGEASFERFQRQSPEQRRLDHHQTRLDIQARRLNEFEAEMRGRMARLEIAKKSLDRRLTELDENLAKEVEERDHGQLVRGWSGWRKEGGALVRHLDADVALLRDAACPPQGAPPMAEPVRPGGLAWERKRNCMVDSGGAPVLDLSDYDNLSPRDHDLLEKLADLWSAWGEKGYLRERLATEPCKTIHWFDQLRSELLAKPWREGA